MLTVCALCAAPPPNYSVLPALERTHRYVMTGTLQQSLFGVVKLAFDRLTKRQVAIKISRRDLSQASQARSGVTVLENVKREAQVMRYLREVSALAGTHTFACCSSLLRRITSILTALFPWLCCRLRVVSIARWPRVSTIARPWCRSRHCLLYRTSLMVLLRWT
jgi:serine/threonine protein kinase